MSLDFQAFLFWACYRVIRFVTRFWHKTGTFLERFFELLQGGRGALRSYPSHLPPLEVKKTLTDMYARPDQAK